MLLSIKGFIQNEYVDDIYFFIKRKLIKMMMGKVQMTKKEEQEDQYLKLKNNIVVQFRNVQNNMGIAFFKRIIIN